MKRFLILAGFAWLVTGFAPRIDFNAGIHGTIDPPDGAKKIWAVSGTDSVSTVPVAGRFAMEVKPGNWTVIAEAAQGYKNAVVTNVQVLESQSTDVGVIRLQTKPN